MAEIPIPRIDSWSDEVAWGPQKDIDALENIPGFVKKLPLPVEIDTEE